MTLDTKIGDTDAMIEERFRRHRHAEIILSMPGFGVILGAEFLTATGGDIAAFGNTDRLAAAAGLAPVPRDSGRISGNLKRPRRYNRRLLRACYLASHIAIRTDTASRIYYDRKRAQGKRHPQAVLALARRRINVMWAMLRDHKPYQPTAPNAAADDNFIENLFRDWSSSRWRGYFSDVGLARSLAGTPNLRRHDVRGGAQHALRDTRRASDHTERDRT
jgi:hypothetical protein